VNIVVPEVNLVALQRKYFITLYCVHVHIYILLYLYIN